MEEHVHVPTYDYPPDCHPKTLQKTYTPRAVTDLIPKP